MATLAYCITNLEVSKLPNIDGAERKGGAGLPGLIGHSQGISE